MTLILIGTLTVTPLQDYYDPRNPAHAAMLVDSSIPIKKIGTASAKKKTKEETKKKVKKEAVCDDDDDYSSDDDPSDDDAFDPIENGWAYAEGEEAEESESYYCHECTREEALPDEHEDGSCSSPVGGEEAEP